MYGTRICGPLTNLSTRRETMSVTYSTSVSEYILRAGPPKIIFLSQGLPTDVNIYMTKTKLSL